MLMAKNTTKNDLGDDERKNNRQRLIETTYDDDDDERGEVETRQKDVGLSRSLIGSHTGAVVDKITMDSRN